MAKSDQKKVVAANRTQAKTKKGGLDEFDKLFSDKKKQDKQAREEEAKQEAARKAAKKARYKNNNSGTCQKTTSKLADMSGAEWVDDGLGGKYNKEGYTGRVEDGVKIFKRHILNKPGAGNTKDCPFDCMCCFI